MVQYSYCIGVLKLVNGSASFRFELHLLMDTHDQVRQSILI